MYNLPFAAVKTCTKRLKFDLLKCDQMIKCDQIDQNDPRHFSNTSMLIESLHNGLLPICDSSNSYKFVVDLVSDKNAGTELISSILQLPQIN